MRNYDHTATYWKEDPGHSLKTKGLITIVHNYLQVNILFVPPSPIGKKYWLVYIELTFELGDIWVNRGM
jgi:hypothetical protein